MDWAAGELKNKAKLSPNSVLAGTSVEFGKISYKCQISQSFPPYPYEDD